MNSYTCLSKIEPIDCPIFDIQSKGCFSCDRYVHIDTIIKINRIEPQEVMVFKPNDELLGSVNQYELNDLCIQIKANKIKGYYIAFNGHRLDIDEHGRIITLGVIGFFDLFEEQLSKIMGF